MAQVTITAADGGSFSAYLAAPAGGSGPGIVVAQEIFGVNQVMRDICDGLAAQGYFAICPDIFWRQEPGIDITDQSEAEWAKAFELFQGFNEDLGIEDLKAALAFLRGHAGVGPKVGSIGYCLGGKLAYLMATRSDADACVSYYGVAIEKALKERGNIKAPLLMHMAEKDQFVPPEAQAEIRSSLMGNPWVTIHTYTGMDHAFCRVGGEHYDQANADQANQRSADFLTTHLS